jgi:hypothetical protein
LKQLPSVTSAASIDTLAASLNVVTAGNDEWGTTETNVGNRAARNVLPPYTRVTIGASPVTVCSVGQPLEYNKAGNVRYLRLTGDGSARTLRVTGPTGTVPLLGRSTFTAGSSTVSISGTTPVGDFVISVGECAVANSPFSSGTSACLSPAPPSEQCWTVTLQ